MDGEDPKELEEVKLWTEGVWVPQSSTGREMPKKPWTRNIHDEMLYDLGPNFHCVKLQALGVVCHSSSRIYFSQWTKGPRVEKK